MAKIISLKVIVDALDMLNENTEAFLDRESGEVIYITEDDRFELESDDPDSVPDWQREHLAKIREVVETDRAVALPTSFDIHEWSIMKNFCNTIAAEQERGQLLDAIEGKGAFRMFRSTVDRLGLKDQWFAFRHSALEQVAREWLENKNIPYE